MAAESEQHHAHPGNHTNQHPGDHTNHPSSNLPIPVPAPAAPLRAAPAATAAAVAAAAPHAAAAIATTAAAPHAAAAASMGLHPSVLAALAGVLLGMIACIGTCIVCRIYRRTRYYKKVQHSLEEEERAFQASLSLKYGEGGEPSSLDEADKERLQMVENYLDSVGPAEQRDAKDVPTKVEDVESPNPNPKPGLSLDSNPDPNPTPLPGGGCRCLHAGVGRCGRGELVSRRAPDVEDISRSGRV